MPTSRAPHPPPSALVVALAGAILWPVAVVARLAPWKSATGDVMATGWPSIVLVLLAAGQAAAWTWKRHGAARTALFAACTTGALALGAGAAALVGDTGWLDPTGHGTFGPNDLPVVVALAVAAVALIAGWFLPTLPLPQRAARDDLPLTALGALYGLLALTPVCATVLARQTPERTVVQVGVTRVVGPLVPLMMWTGLLAASVGVVAAVVVAGATALVRRRLHAPALRGHYVHLVASLVAGGFVLRVVALLTANDARRDAGDPFFYHVTANLLAHARNFDEPVTWVASGDHLASALHGPAFPAALSLWSRLGGTGYFDHQLASIVLGVPQVLAVVVLARLLFGRRAALVAGALAVVYPNMWVTDGSLFVEGLMAVFTTLATWCAYRFRARPHWGWTVALGAMVGLAALTRGEAVLLMVLLLVPLVLRTPRLVRRDRWRHLAIGSAAFLATLAPWMFYNAGRFNVFVPLSTNSNEVLFYANCDTVYSGNTIGFWSFDCQQRYRQQYGEPPGDQAEKAVFWRQQGIDFAKDHLGQLPKVVVARVGRQWELFRPWQTVDLAFIEGRPRTAVLWGQRMYYVMMALSVAATLALRRRGTPTWPLWVHALAVTATAAYAYGTLRFRAPFEPILCVFAGIGAVWLWDLARARLRARKEVPDVALAS